VLWILKYLCEFLGYNEIKIFDEGGRNVMTWWTYIIPSVCSLLGILRRLACVVFVNLFKTKMILEYRYIFILIEHRKRIFAASERGHSEHFQYVLSRTNCIPIRESPGFLFHSLFTQVITRESCAYSSECLERTPLKRFSTHSLDLTSQLTNSPPFPIFNSFHSFKQD